MSTLTTTAIYQNGVLLPKTKPTFEPKEVVVVYVGENNDEGEVELSPEWKTMIDESIAEVERGEIHGPFDSLEDMMGELRKE